MTYYLHTLGGKPAAFDGRQVHFATHGSRLVASLKQIRAEQRASAEFRASKGYRSPWPYGYLRILPPKFHDGER